MTLTITRHSQLQTLYYTITHFVKERNSTSSQCSDWQSPRNVTSSQKTSDMHDLSMIFDQQDLVTTNGRVSLHDILGVYQDIYNNNISMDTGSSSVSFMILSAIEQVLFELLSRINVVNIQISSIFLQVQTNKLYSLTREKLQSGSKFA